MKKLFSIILTIICTVFACFVFSSCTEIFREREQRKEQVLAIKGKGGHIYVGEEGYMKDGKMVYFSDLIVAEVKKDKTVELPESDTRFAVDALLYKDIAYFTMRYNVSEDDKETDVIVGYINIKDNSVVYFNTHISTREEYGIYLMPTFANARYFAFIQIREYTRKDVYYIIDRENNLLLEKISDRTPYKDGTEKEISVVIENGIEYELIRTNASYDYNNALKYNEETLEIDYAYVLSRSAEMQEIDGIMANYKRDTYEALFCYENRLYVVIESQSGMFGRGELDPVVFEYTISTDSFEYIGCAYELGWYNAILGIVPYA